METAAAFFEAQLIPFRLLPLLPKISIQGLPQVRPIDFCLAGSVGLLASLVLGLFKCALQRTFSCSWRTRRGLTSTVCCGHWLLFGTAIQPPSNCK